MFRFPSSVHRRRIPIPDWTRSRLGQVPALFAGTFGRRSTASLPVWTLIQHWKGCVANVCVLFLVAMKDRRSERTGLSACAQFIVEESMRMEKRIFEQATEFARLRAIAAHESNRRADKSLASSQRYRTFVTDEDCREATGASIR